MTRTTVYAICNYATGEAYIGQTRYVSERLKSHQRLLQKGEHHNNPLQSAWRQYGPSAFGLIILERCDGPLWIGGVWANQQERRWLGRARAAGVVLYNDQVDRGRQMAM